jgi:hypothetical protein
MPMDRNGTARKRRRDEEAMSYDEHLISMAGGDGDVHDAGTRLARAILTRRLRKCIAEGSHADGVCARCGQ